MEDEAEDYMRGSAPRYDDGGGDLRSRLRSRSRSPERRRGGGGGEHYQGGFGRSGFRGRGGGRGGHRNYDNGFSRGGDNRGHRGQRGFSDGLRQGGGGFRGDMQHHGGGFYQQQQQPFHHNTNNRGSFRGSGGGRGMRNGGGGRMDDAEALPDLDPAQSTVTLYEVPEEVCKPSVLLPYYKSFGNVHRIKCNARNRRAHIMFETREEADAAIMSTEPVLGIPQIFVQVRKQGTSKTHDTNTRATYIPVDSRERFFPSTHGKRGEKLGIYIYIYMCVCRYMCRYICVCVYVCFVCVHAQMSLYDILPLRDSVKASFDYEYAHFFYDVEDPSTHFAGHDELANTTTHATGFNPHRAERQKYKWRNSEAMEKSDQEMDVGGSKTDEKEAMVTKAKQLEELIARRKKALEVMEERKKIEEKMLRIQQAQKEENDFLKQCEDEMNATT